MRIPVAVSLESRDGSVSKDAKVVNGIVEARGDQPVLRKRPGTADLGQVWTTGTAQLLYPWNGLWAIYGDVLFNGTQSTIVSPSFATWSTTDKGAGVTLSNGNLTYSATANNMVRATLGESAGKFYWEVTAGVGTELIGIAKSGATLSGYVGSDANGWSYCVDGTKFNSGSALSYGSSFTTGDVIGIALDCDVGTVAFYKNGVSQGTAYSSLSGTFFPAASGGGAATGAGTANFGAAAFIYSPPTGFTAGVPTAGTSLGPTTGGLRFDAQEVGASAATQLMMIKNRTQAWTITRAGVKSAISFASSMGAATYAVTALTRSGTTATATLSTDPGVNVGDSITVAGASPSGYNVTANVTAITPYSFTPAVNLPLTITRSGTTATATTTSAHGLTSGSYALSGAGQSEYNGTKSITVTTSTAFTFTVTVTTYSVYGAAVTLNPSDKTANTTLSGGNLTATLAPTGAGWAGVRATTGTSSGTKKWEITVGAFSGGQGTLGIGLVTAGFNFPSDFFDSAGPNSWGLGNISSFSSTGVYGFAYNASTGILNVYLNGALYVTRSGISGTVYPAIEAAFSNGTPSVSATINFGATAFTYSYGDDPITPATGSPVVTKPAVTVNAAVSYPVSGSPTTPATGTITLTTNGGMVPGLPYIDGYFFVMDNNGVMWASAIDDPTSWPALNNLTAQNENGKGKALYKSANNLVALKEWSTEFFYDAKQTPGFPFLPVDNGFSQIGCASGDSVARIDGKLVWVSQVKERGRSVHIMAGMAQQSISTPDIERILNNDDLATVYAYGIKLGGHSLYVLTLVTSNITLVYDLSSQAWAQWSSLTTGNTVSVSSITQANGIATVTTATAHGRLDGDPVTIAGADQNEYNGTFQISYVSTTVFTITVASTAATPATGTITVTPYTSSYFKFTKYADYQGLNLFLHQTNGHLYQMLPTLYQDAGLPIDLMFRTSRLDGGSSEVKTMSRLSVIGDAITDTLVIRQSDDDCATFTTYRPVDLSNERPSLRRLGKFRRRTLEGRHIGNTNPRIEAIELEVQ